VLFYFSSWCKGKGIGEFENLKIGEFENEEI
jgi:hypothetical protein